MNHCSIVNKKWFEETNKNYSEFVAAMCIKGCIIVHDVTVVINDVPYMS